MGSKTKFLTEKLALPAFMVLFAMILPSTYQQPAASMNIPHGRNPLSQKQLVAQNQYRMPLSFTRNQGQWDEQVLFRAEAGRAVMWFTRAAVYYHFTRPIPDRGPQKSSSAPFDHQSDGLESLIIKASFVGSNPHPEIVGQTILEHKCNYFMGNDAASWHTGVPNYRTLHLREIYPGINLEYYSNSGGMMEYDFIVSPDADYTTIRVEYEGANSIAVNDAGELIVETDWMTIIEQQPRIYQVVGGERRPIEGRYVLRSGNSFGFELCNDYNPHLPLVIDPVLRFSTYLGGNSSDAGMGIAVDGAGNAYITGYTNSDDFPTPGAYQTDQGSYDVFVTKLNTAGNQLVYSTYLGGEGEDRGIDIAVDDAGNAYITGWTLSDDFPTQGEYQTHQQLRDAFVTKLNSTGNALVFSTYLGGNGEDQGRGIAVDCTGNAYLTGWTESTDFPTQGAYQADQNRADAFVTKLNTAGNGLVYSTYLGGNRVERGTDIAVDGIGNAYIAGWTQSTNFPTLGEYQTDQGLTDVFVTRLNSAGNALVFSTYLGGDDEDQGRGIAIDDAGNVYIAGFTASTNFPTQGAYQTDQPRIDAFVTKLNNAGNGLVYSTYLGGRGADRAFDIAVDGMGNAYITGRTTSNNFPTQGEYQTYQGLVDVFVTQLDPAGNGLVYSTYLGGDDNDYGFKIEVDRTGNVYVTGETSSTNFPTQGEYQTNQGLADAFVTKMSGVQSYNWQMVCEASATSSLIALQPLDLQKMASLSPEPDFVPNSFGVHLTFCEPIHLPAGDAAEVFVDVDGSGTFDCDEQYPAAISWINGNLARDATVRVVLGNEMPANNTRVAIYSVAGIHLLDEILQQLDYLSISNVFSYLDDQQPLTAGQLVPDVFSLEPNHPNPFNAQTAISYTLGSPGHVRLEVYDIVGRRVTTLVNQAKAAGEYEVTWDGLDSHGRPVASGMYFVKLVTADYMNTRKMILLK